MSLDPTTRVAQLQSELDGLRRALRTRATIEQAMGVLVVLRRCSPKEAFDALVRLSQQYNTKLHRVAHLVVGMFAEPAIEPLDAYLRRNTGADEPDDPGAEPLRLDEALLDAARALVAAGGEPDELERAMHDLYRVLVEQGWVPPYDILGPIADGSGARS
ncbi:ANTAR domain-containing protein [Actinokineospora iranica]|uniref:ANTAR domain-containing protein n=1 Tax=Actinokineospora iranica TaxID=1271860 RepID=A0A1G6K607_9PSEU|nr:ANTAR domain-containing protein [Actinokineospora iranica]SDC26479.1 ANTAR domain-containing protein [Actinokineospora iranica]